MLSHLFKFSQFSLFTIFSILVTPTLLNADIIWSESIDGDLSNFENSPTAVGLVIGQNDFIGIIGGTSDPNNGDGYDVFAFTIGPDETLDSIIINDYQVAGGNRSTGFNIFRSDGTYLGGIAMNQSRIGGDILTISTLGSLGEGDYYISLREFTAPGQTYDFTMNISTSAVPEPAAGFVLVLSAPFILFRRRKR